MKLLNWIRLRFAASDTQLRLLEEMRAVARMNARQARRCRGLNLHGLANTLDDFALQLHRKVEAIEEDRGLPLNPEHDDRCN